MTKMITFEDLAEGAVFWGEEVVVDRVEMVEYARRYDPWPFHVDAEVARRTPFGGLVASAGYTFSLWCQSLHSIIRNPGAEWAFLGGYDLRVKLLQPVRPDHHLRLKLTIGRKRLSTKPGRGHVDSLHVFMMPDGVPVFSVELGFLIGTRTSA
jgi:acyl dehydratase